MKVLVTGGGGFLGFHIVKQLIERGETVTVIGRHHYPHVARLGATSIVADIRNYASIESHFKETEEVFHTAATADIWGDWQKFYDINFVGTKNVVDACLAHGIKRLIHTSSPSVVFDGKSQKNLDESTPYASKWLAHYPRSKMLAEKYVLEHNSPQLQTVALRPHLIWGPGDPHIFPRLISKAKKGQLAIVGDGQNEVDIIYVENAAKGHLQAAEALKNTGAPAGKTYFLGQSAPVKIWDFITEVLKRENVAAVNKRIPFRFTYALAVILEWTHKLFRIKSEPRMTRFLACQLSQSHYYNHKRAKDDFGYDPKISVEEGLDRIYADQNP